MFVTQLCPSLCDPMVCSPPGSSVHGILQAKNTGVGSQSLLQRIFSAQGSNLGLLHCRQILYHWATWEAQFAPGVVYVYLPLSRASLAAQKVKNLPAMQETWFRSLGQKDLLEKEMPTHSSILAWRIPWTEEPGGSVGLQRVGHDWVTNTLTFTFI